VNVPDGLPLEKLSAVDKDALIERLWRDLQQERARSNELKHRLAMRDGEASDGSDQLLKKLRQADVGEDRSKESTARALPGLRYGLDFLSTRVLVVVAVLIALAFALDFAVGRYQQYRLAQRHLAELKLQHAAYEGMFIEVVNVAYEADGKAYRVTMKMANVEPGQPLFVMQSPVRVFEQSGLSWKEVPSWDPSGQGARVVKLTDAYTFETIFEPNIADWTELIPGYMHIRFETNSLVSDRSEPDDDIVDRTDRYYVYLKPHRADDDAIRKRTNFKGDPPVYMPMPPH
jgi:hypothetical protein